MERVRRMEHQGREIVLLDASRCTAGEAAQVLRDGRKLIKTMPPGSALTLTDVTAAHFDDAATKEARINAEENAPHVKAAALVGVKGLQKIVYSTISRLTGRDLKLFDTREEALAWLATR